MPELFGEILLGKRLISEEQLKAGLDEHSRTGDRLGLSLARLGFISEAELLKALCVQLDLPFIQGREFPENLPSIEPSIPVTFMRQCRCVPVELEGRVLKVAIADTGETAALEAIAAFTGLEVMACVCPEKDILEKIEEHYGNPEVTMGKIVEEIGAQEAEGGARENVELLKDMALEAPIVNLVNMVVSNAMERRASDIHFEPFEELLHIRFRIDGVLYHVESLPRRLHPAVSSRIKIMARLNIAERRLPQDGRIKLRGSGKDMDVRVSTLPTLYGESIVMRLLDSTGVMGLDSIGLSFENHAALSSLLKQPHGLILSTGPTGSGKTTTLYAALSTLDTSEKKVITIEDPIEYNLKGVNQMQVKPRIGLTFANGLRSIVRQDPDVIMIGEIRDAETADIAVHAALTGHLIFSTLHTNDAPGAVTRLIDMGIENYLISSSLAGVLAQRLVRTICAHCKEEYRPSNEALSTFANCMQATGSEKLAFYRGAGCSNCDKTGYRGRTGVFELMLVTDRIRGLITENKGSNALKDECKKEGMVSIREDGWQKALSGVTTLEELVRVTLD